MAETITSSQTNEVGAIQNNLPGQAMRVAIENKDLLKENGSVYVGTGETNHIEISEGVEYDVPVTKAAVPNSGETGQQYLVHEDGETKFVTQIDGSQVTEVPNATNATNATNYIKEGGGVESIEDGIKNLETKILTGKDGENDFVVKSSQNASVAQNYDSQSGTIKTGFSELQSNIASIESRLDKLGFKSARIYNTTVADDNTTLVKGEQIGTVKRQGNYVVIDFARTFASQAPVAILADEGFSLEKFFPKGVDMYAKFTDMLGQQFYTRYSLSRTQVTYPFYENILSYVYLQYSEELGGCLTINNRVDSGNGTATGVVDGSYGYEADPIQ